MLEIMAMVPMVIMVALIFNLDFMVFVVTITTNLFINIKFMICMVIIPIPILVLNLDHLKIRIYFVVSINYCFILANIKEILVV
jgi:hypothetical protein